MLPFLFKFLKISVLLVLIGFPLFGHLGALPIQIWDESRLALNALEMLKNGDFLVTHFEDAPDLWNTKPPLMIWLQVISLKILGIGELAIRLPSALAALLTCGVLWLFSARFLKNERIGLVAIFVLVTSSGYISLHGTRTGDYDALLTLFTTIFALSFFVFCQRPKAKYLYFTFGAVALAVLTKSVAGLLFAPALLFYSLWKKQFLPLFTNRHFYFGIALFLLTVSGFYGLRELAEPGFLQAVYDNELGGRFLETKEFHQQEFLYYLKNLWRERFIYWKWVIPFSFLTILFSGKAKWRNTLGFLLLVVSSFLLIISKAGTKLAWYDLPIYPFLALIVAMGIVSGIQFLEQKMASVSLSLKRNFGIFVLLLLFIFPYKKTVESIFTTKIAARADQSQTMSVYLQAIFRGEKEIPDKIVHKGYAPQNWFYVKAINQKKERLRYRFAEDLVAGETVIAVQEEAKQAIETLFEVDVLEERKNLIKYQLNERK